MPTPPLLETPAVDKAEPLPGAAPRDPLSEARTQEHAGELTRAEVLYREAATRAGEEGATARIGLARVLGRLDRHQEALEALGVLEPSARFEARLLLAESLEALGRAVEAARAYSIAARAPGATESEGLEDRIRSCVERMHDPELRELAEGCPLCVEGGYARLRLGRVAMEEGRLGEAEAGFRALAADFARTAIGVTASELEQEVASRRVKQGLYGVLLPLSGPLRPFGLRALRGALLGSGLFSEQDDPGIRLAVADTEGDPAVGARGVEALARRGVVGVLGPLKGTVSMEAARVARTFGVPLVTLTPAAEVTREGAFRLHLREEDEISRLVAYAMETRGLRRFAILYAQTEPGARYSELFREEVSRRGGVVTGAEIFSPGTGDVAEAIRRLTSVHALSRRELRERFVEEEKRRLLRERKLRAVLDLDGSEDSEPQIKVDEARLASYKPRPVVDFDAVFLPVPSVEAAQVAPQFPFQDISGIVLLGIRSWNYQAFVQVGGEYVEGAIFPAEFDPDNPGAQGFSEAYREAYGEEPGVLEAYAFDAIRLLSRGSGDGRPETRQALREQIESVRDLEGVTGRLTCLSGGEISATPRILTVKRGRIVPAQ